MIAQAYTSITILFSCLLDPTAIAAAAIAAAAAAAAAAADLDRFLGNESN